MIEFCPLLELNIGFEIFYNDHFPPGETGRGISREDYIGQVARDIQSKLPTRFDLDLIRKGLGPDVSPTSVVLLQELERFNRLVLRMSQSLAELQRVSLAGGGGVIEGETDAFSRSVMVHAFVLKIFGVALPVWYASVLNERSKCGTFLCL